MKYAIFTIPALHPAESMAELNRFLATHKTATVEKEFFSVGQSAYWSFIVCYLDNADMQATTNRKNTIDYREVLSKEEFSRFTRLRELRNKLAKEEGKPAYAVFTNEQLAKMVDCQVKSLAGLQEIDGVGEARLEQYASHFLPLLQELHERPGK